jgi:hypothetical protein
MFDVGGGVGWTAVMWFSGRRHAGPRDRVDSYNMILLRGEGSGVVAMIILWFR